MTGADDPNEREDEISDRVDGDPERTARTPSPVAIDVPSVDVADALAGWWIALADEQRQYRSHLLGEANRRLIREAIARHITTGGLLIARLDGERGSRTDVEDPLDRRQGNGAELADIVGFVMFGPETGSYEQSIDRGIMENVYVRPEYRNRGVGTALLEAAEATLYEQGVDAIALEVMADNEAARRFYAERGYKPHRLELEASIEALSPPADERSTPPENDRDTNERG